MPLQQKPVVHIVRHACYRRLGVLFDCWEPGYGQSFMLGEKFNLEGGRGPYITHILTSKELRATQTAHEALEAMERIGIEVKEYAVLRGEPEGKNAKNHLREIIESLPRHKSDRIEVVVVTHRRFIDNILERSYEEPDFRPTEFRSYVVDEDGTLTLAQLSTLPTQIQTIRQRLENERDPNDRWTPEMRLSLEEIIEKQEKITIWKAMEIKYLRKRARHWQCTVEFWSGNDGGRYPRRVCKDDFEFLFGRLDDSIEDWEEAWWRQKLAREMVLLLTDIEVTGNDISFKEDFEMCVEVVQYWSLRKQGPDIRAYVRSKRLDVEGHKFSIMRTTGLMDHGDAMAEIQRVDLERSLIAPFLKGTKWEEKLSIPMVAAMAQGELMNSRGFKGKLL